MKGVYPALAGTVLLLAGAGLTWMLAVNSYTNICRLTVEKDYYACWSLMAIPFLVGVGATALGGFVFVKGVLSMPWPRQVMSLKSPKLLFAVGFLPLAAVWVLAFELYTSSALLRNSYTGTFLFLVFLGILFFLGVQWVMTSLKPRSEGNFSTESSQEPTATVYST